jgi:hypothetical protein
MKAVAIIVGINDYRDQPLTSAVADALAFRDALTSLGLVDPDSITLLTAPAQAGSTLATRDGITAALREPYRNGDDIDRLFVFFSGHGMLVQSNASQTTSATAFLPADIADPADEPWKLLDIDDLLRSFRSAGPREQFFFIDACRNLRYDQYPPDLPPIGLSGRKQPPVGARGQSALYAVAPGGQALGNVGGLGVMTTHLVQALHGAGEAMDWDDERDGHVITAQSVYAYVAARISEQVADLAHWQREYMLPDQQNNGPPLTPIRLVPDPGPGRLTLTVDPPEDAQYVQVSVLQRGARLAAPQWPPALFGTPVEVPRQRFRLSAGSHFGATGVEPELVDGRTMTTALIKHKYMGPLGPGPTTPYIPQRAPGDLGLGPALVTYSGTAGYVTTRGGRITGGRILSDREVIRQPGWLEAEVAEPWSAVEVAGLDPPYRSQSVRVSAAGQAELALPAGSYRVKFRIGSQQFSETTAEIEAGQTTKVRASAFASPLAASLFGPAEPGPWAGISERFGPVQANPALTLAALTALSRAHGLLETFHSPEPLPPLRKPGPDRWLSLAIVVDGSVWERPAAEIAAGLTAEITTPRAYHQNPVELSPMGASAGLDQVVGGAALLPLSSSTLVVRSAQIGQLELAVTASPRMVTSVGMVLRADGGLDVAQLLTPVRLDESDVEKHVRRSLLGQWLYQSGELISYGHETAIAELGDIVTGQAIDPVLSPMAYHALVRMIAAGDVNQPRFARRDQQQIVYGLISEFPELVDLAVLAADFDAYQNPAADLLAEGQLPMLADSLRLAMTWPQWLPESTRRLAATVRPGSLWTLRRTQPQAGGPDRP